jgi:tRNA(fMet)-specific endonuclease VapC
MVIDSTVFIEHLRAKDRTKTTLATLPANSFLYVSAVTVFELFCGATDPGKHRDVQKVFKDVLILPVNAAVGEKAGEIFRDLRSKGSMIEATDIFIAATALVNNLPVKTLNTRHFSRVHGLMLV